MSESLVYSATVVDSQALSVPESAGFLAGPAVGGHAFDALEPDALKIAAPHDEIIRIAFPRNTHLDGESAAALIAHVLGPDEARPIGVLLELNDLSSVSRAARAVISNLPSVAAWALLGQSPVDRILAHFFLGAEFKSGPARYFESGIDAIAWLKEYVRVR